MAQPATLTEPAIASRLRQERLLSRQNPFTQQAQTPPAPSQSLSGQMRQTQNQARQNAGLDMYAYGKRLDSDYRDAGEGGNPLLRNVVYDEEGDQVDDARDIDGTRSVRSQLLQAAGRLTNRFSRSRESGQGSGNEEDESAGSFGKVTKFSSAQAIRALWQGMLGVYSAPLCLLGLDIFAILHIIFPKLISGVGEAWVPMPLKLKGGSSYAMVAGKFELGWGILLLIINLIVFFVVIAITTVVVFIIQSFLGQALIFIFGITD